VVDITDLHYSVTNDELKELAESFGKVRWCKVEWDSMGRSKVFLHFLNRNVQV
jgi:RNA recognition motif-containing protein